MEDRVAKVWPTRVVVVGGGLAAVRVCERLRALGYEGVLTVLCAERHAPYDRPPLSKQILSGAWDPERAELLTAERQKTLRIDVRLGMPATGLDPTGVQISTGVRIAADAVVIATGAVARLLPNQPESPVVHTLRTLDHTLRLREALTSARRLVIVGAGFVGAEVASVARDLGIAVTVLETLSVPLARVLGETGGELCGRLMTEAGVDLRVDTAVQSIAVDGTVTLRGGECLEADQVLVSIGSRADVDWLGESSALSLGNGIACDATGRALGADHVWALGDVSAWPDPLRQERHRHEHWTKVADQANVVAADILGLQAAPPAVPYFWSDQFGLKVQLIGYPEIADHTGFADGSALDTGRPVKGTLLNYYAGDRLVGALGFGAAKRMAEVRRSLLPPA